MTTEQLKTYFASKELPQTVQLYPHAKIVDVKKFVEAHLGYADMKLKTLSNNYKERLIHLVNLLENEQNKNS